MPKLEPLVEDINIEALPTTVWELVGDPRRLPEWSPQVRGTSLLDGASDIALGVRFVNRNKENGLEWNTHGQVVRFEPCHMLAFEIEENWLVWSFTLEETADGGTHLIQRREAPRGISDFAHGLTEKYMGGTTAFTHSMQDSMRQTLRGIKAACEQLIHQPQSGSLMSFSTASSADWAPALTTDRLQLDLPRLDDAAAVLAIAGDRRTVKHNPSDMIHDLEEAKGLLRRWARQWEERGIGYWCVRETGQARVVGYCGVKHMIANGETVLNLICRLAPEVWDQGYATEATRAAVTWASNQQREETILARVRPDNAASRRVALKSGLQRDSAYDGDGEDGQDLAYTNRHPTTKSSIE